MKDAMFSSSLPQLASTSSLGGRSTGINDGQANGHGLAGRSLTAADLAALFAQCSSDFGTLSSHLGPFGPHPPMIDLEMMKMWNTAPTSLQCVHCHSSTHTELTINLRLDEWGTFISNVGQLTQASRPNSTAPEVTI